MMQQNKNTITKTNTQSQSLTNIVRVHGFLTWCRLQAAIIMLTNAQVNFDESDREFIAVKSRGRPPKSNNGALNKK